MTYKLNEADAYALVAHKAGKLELWAKCGGDDLMAGMAGFDPKATIQDITDLEDALSGRALGRKIKALNDSMKEPEPA